MTIERRVLNLGRLFALLLVLVSLRIIYWQMVQIDNLSLAAVDPAQAAEYYAELGGEKGEDSENPVDVLTGLGPNRHLEDIPQPVIQRTIDLLNNIERGSIYDRSGRLLASDRLLEDGTKIRFYNEPSLVHVVGYVSGMRTGVTGLEAAYNTTLLGLDRPDAQVREILHEPVLGSSLTLTIDSSVQRAAEKTLEGKTGSILVLDAKDGAVLALANAPRFDPNRVLEDGYIQGLIDTCGGALHCRAPFINRATQALYPPGSTWKTAALIAALDTGQVSPETVFDFGEPVQGEDGSYFVYRVDGGIIPDPNHKEQRLDLEMSYAKSANAAFARIGDEMPADILIEYASRLGYGDPGEILPSLEIETAPSQLAADTGSLFENNLLRAATAIGQGELLTSPLNVGMMVLSVVNGGELPVPYFVHSINDPGGRVVEDLPNRQTIDNIMKPETAELVRQMMISVVTKGSGKSAQISGLMVGGKTGTAQVGGDLEPHSWFAGFAENGERSVVVVVLIENGGEGSSTAAPIFASVAAAALQHQGEPVEEVVPTPVPAPTQEEEPEPQPTAPPPAEETPAPTPVPEVEEGEASGLTPDITRDPEKKDITAANPTCANLGDIPQGTGSFIWPSPYQALSGGNFREGHPGFDLAAPTGSKVSAADTGLVIFAGWSGLGYGNAVLIDHGNGYQTLYAHLSHISTFCGEKVEKGDLIGLSGNTGNSTGPHLHFEVRVPGGYIDPVKVLPVP